MERVATFDSYVRPECDIWDQRCINIHQIHPEDDRTASAHSIDQVWLQFKSWLNRHVGVRETIILVAWNGMENHKRDLATCKKAPSSLVNARCVFLCEGIDKWHHALPIKR